MRVRAHACTLYMEKLFFQKKLKKIWSVQLFFVSLQRQTTTIKKERI